jgi:hypothetical protein
VEKIINTKMNQQDENFSICDRELNEKLDPIILTLQIFVSQIFILCRTVLKLAILSQVCAVDTTDIPQFIEC